MNPCWKALALSLLMITSTASYSQQLRPTNPDTLRVINQKLPALIPPSVLLPTPVTPRSKTQVSYPTSYDLRTASRCSPVQDQGYSNGCWAFSSIASIEGRLLPGTSTNLSEMNMINNHGYDWLPSYGGNRGMATAYTARWDGPVLESDDPFIDTNDMSPTTLPSPYHVQDVIWLPSRTGFADNDAIKSCVQTYGPVAADMYWSPNTYTASTASIYNSVDHDNNHMVSIIGWDDNYSRTNFKQSNGAPAGDGAFLFKNSWGTDWGVNGYGWISYYDVSLSKFSSVYTSVLASNSYTHVYQYDPLGWSGSIGYGSNTGYLGAIYTAQATEQIQAVSFYNSMSNSSCQAAIYLNPTTVPVSGTAYGVTNGTLAYPGYHTITLSSPVTITAGSKFGVVVKLTTPGDNYPIPMERCIPGYTSKATASAGQTFISGNGTSWTDLTSYYPNASVCLKAFGKLTTSSRMISGNIALEGYIGDARFETLQAQVKQNGSTTASSFELKRSISGNYTISQLPSGTYSMRIWGSHFPAVTVNSLNLTSGDKTGINITLPNGNADGDGQVNLFDYVQLDMDFGDMGYYLSADMDGSLSVDLFDYVILDQNFGAQASTPL